MLREIAFRGEMPEDAARSALSMLVALPIAYEAPGALAAEATSVARDLGRARRMTLSTWR